MNTLFLLGALFSIAIAQTFTTFRFSTQVRLPEDKDVQIFSQVSGFVPPDSLRPWNKVDYYDLCGFNCSSQGIVRADKPDTSNPNYANLAERERNAGGHPDRFKNASGWVVWRNNQGQIIDHYWGPFCHYDCGKVKSTPSTEPLDTNAARKQTGLFNKVQASEYQARWGEPVDDKNEMSGFGFIPIVSDPLHIGSEVIIGQMVHYNRPVYSPANKFLLSFLLRIWEESAPQNLLSKDQYSWTFNIDETPNWQPQRECEGKIPAIAEAYESYNQPFPNGPINFCPYKSVLTTAQNLVCTGQSFTFPKCPDNITFTQDIASNPVFTLNNVKYTLSLSGFKLKGSTRPSTYFFSEENAITIQDLYARVIAACPVECAEKNYKPFYNATTGKCECDCPQELKDQKCPEGQIRNSTCECSCPKCSDGSIAVYNATTKSCPCPCAVLKKCKPDTEIYDPNAPIDVPVGEEGKCGDCLCKHGSEVCNGANFTTDKPPCVTCKCVLNTCVEKHGGIASDYVQDSVCNCSCVKTCNSQEVRNGTCGCMCKYRDCPMGLLSYTNFTKKDDCNCECDKVALTAYCTSLNRPAVFEQYNFDSNSGKCHCGGCPPPYNASTPLDKCECPITKEQCIQEFGTFGKFVTDNKTICRCECDQTALQSHCGKLNLKSNSTTCQCIPCVETGEDRELKKNCTENSNRYYVCSNLTNATSSNETNGCGGCIPPYVQNPEDECACPLTARDCLPKTGNYSELFNKTKFNITGECTCYCEFNKTCANATHYWNQTTCHCAPRPQPECVKQMVPICAAKGQVVSTDCPAGTEANCCCKPCPAHDCCADSNITSCKMTKVIDGKTCNQCICDGNFTCAADECKITGPIIQTANGTEGQCGCDKQASCACDAAAHTRICEAKNEVAVITQDSCNCTCPPPKVMVNGTCTCTVDCGGCSRDDKECKCNVQEVANFTCSKFCETPSTTETCTCVNGTAKDDFCDCTVWSQANCPAGSKVVYSNSTNPPTCQCEQCPLTEANCTNNGTNLNKFRPAPECDCVCPYTSSNHPCKWFEEFSSSNCSCIPATKCPDTDPDCCPIKKAQCDALNRGHEINFVNQTCGCGDCLGNWTNVNGSLALTHNSTEKCDQCPSKCVGNFKDAPRATDECNFECVCDTFQLTCNKTCYQTQNVTACECINVTSTCVCGDGIVDPFAGETCDPGHKVGNGTVTDPCCDPNTCQPKTEFTSCSLDPCKALGQCVKDANSSKLVCNQSAPLCPETDCNTLDACVVINGTAKCNYIPSANKTDCGNGQGKCNEWCVFDSSTNTSSCQKRDFKCVPPAGLNCELPCCLYACSPTTGECEAKWFPNSTCSDGDICTENDKCVPNPDSSNSTKVICAGTKKCTDLINENPCKNITCNAAGQCETIILEDGLPCENGDECQQPGTKKCRKGECRGLAKVCNTTNECIQVTCQRYRARPRYGECIENFVALFNNPCDDGNNCTVGDYCGRNGTCLPGFDQCEENESVPILPIALGAGALAAVAAIAAILVGLKTQASGITNAATWGVFDGADVNDNPLFAAQTVSGENALYGMS